MEVLVLEQGVALNVEKRAEKDSLDARKKALRELQQTVRQAKIFYSAPSSVTYRTFTVSSPEGEHECLRLGTQRAFR